MKMLVTILGLALQFSAPAAHAIESAEHAYQRLTKEAADNQQKSWNEERLKRAQPFLAKFQERQTRNSNIAEVHDAALSEGDLTSSAWSYMVFFYYGNSPCEANIQLSDSRVVGNVGCLSGIYDTVDVYTK